ncbi:MAG: RNA polymerase sigma factor [Wenzhouxiangella sp.]
MLDETEFERLYHGLEKRLFNIAWRWTWNSAEAQELVHEGFIRIWARRATIDPLTAERYLVRTLINLCHKRARRKRRWNRVRELLPLPRENPDNPEESFQVHALRRAMESLPDQQRDVLLLTEFTDMKQHQIGELLGIPAGTVASRRNTALRKLKEVMHEH